MIDYESADLWLYRFAVKHSATREEGVESHLLESPSFQARAIAEITTRDDPLTIAFVERILLKDRNLEFKAFFQSLVLAILGLSHRHLQLLALLMTAFP